ncbi:biosynthesis protein COQ9 [Seminavis robusta]|uniref:Ubiquinone biosynthesis protein n=1 Tax=Seminavis robusta TaxID=568900 RepID=A0A9N8DEU2_9STRA|nr:biosynthesis protein COQ9 [Seminavis robusta]|eukprot:Sro56_g032610.1 biosynthesis protein COQ9 (372) ;mRNA; f:11967-13234
MQRLLTVATSRRVAHRRLHDGDRLLAVRASALFQRERVVYPTRVGNNGIRLFSSNVHPNSTGTSSGNYQSNQWDPNTTALSNIRTAILKSSLQEVHHHGWTEDALAAGTAAVKQQHGDKKISMSVVGLLSVDDLIAFCMDQWNIQLKQDLFELRHQKQSTSEKDEEKENITSNKDPLERGIQTRLQYLIPYLQSQRWHEGMALGIRGPTNALQTQRQLQEMIEIIIATSNNHPELGTTEKMALGAVYVATELHLLTDTSPQYRDTWAFLSQRMNDWRRLTLLPAGTGTSNSSSSSDTLFVATAVASSLAGGLVSLITTNPSQAFGLPAAVWSSLFHNPQANSWGTNEVSLGAIKDGTHPSDYESQKRGSKS